MQHVNAKKHFNSLYWSLLYSTIKTYFSVILFHLIAYFILQTPHHYLPFMVIIDFLLLCLIVLFCYSLLKCFQLKRASPQNTLARNSADPSHRLMHTAQFGHNLTDDNFEIVTTVVNNRLLDE